MCWIIIKLETLKARIWSRIYVQSYTDVYCKQTHKYQLCWWWPWAKVYTRLLASNTQVPFTEPVIVGAFHNSMGAQLISITFHKYITMASVSRFIICGMLNGWSLLLADGEWEECFVFIGDVDSITAINGVPHNSLKFRRDLTTQTNGEMSLVTWNAINIDGKNHGKNEKHRRNRHKSVTPKKGKSQSSLK